MSDVGNVLTHLCESINMCCDSSLKVEHFFVFQEDALVREAINSLTKSVEGLAQSVVEKKLGRSLSIAHVQDSILRIKLLMAYLRYPLPSFYANLKTKNLHSLNNLILVFGWLIVEQNGLKILISNHLKKNEFYDRKLVKITKLLENNVPSAASIDGILKDSGKLDFDVRQISNLLSTKAKLITKLSSASCGTLNLDHLSLEELALLKRVSENKKEAEPTKEYLKDLHRQATLIEKYTKVRLNITVFIKWIVSFKNRMEKSQTDDSEETFEFLHLLHQVVKANLGSEKLDLSRSNFNDGCLQLRKVENGEVETEVWLQNLVHLSSKLKRDPKHRSVSLNEYFQCDASDT